MTYTQISEERRDNVLLLTLNRPEKLNAWTRTLNRELQQALRRANEDPAVGAIVITGAGRGFCAGADIEGEWRPGRIKRLPELVSRQERQSGHVALELRALPGRYGPAGLGRFRAALRGSETGGRHRP